MRRALLMTLLAVAGTASAEGDDPFKGATKQVSDEKGFITITVPETWAAQPAKAPVIVYMRALSRQGGHVLMVTREEGFADTEANRERYLKYDAAKDDTARIQKIEKPFVGYRIDMPKIRRIVIRAFLGDGDSGIILTLKTRLREAYDQVYARQILAVLGSARLMGGKEGEETVSGDRRRVFDKKRRVSLVVASHWRPMDGSNVDEWLVLARTGGRSGKLTFKRFREAANDNRVLGKYWVHLKKNYAGVSYQSMGDDPPRMLVRNRRPGYVEYVTAYENRGMGYVLVLTVKEAEFAKRRAFADEVSRTVLLLGGAYAPPEAPEGTPVPYKRLINVYGDAKLKDAMDAVAAEGEAFENGWKKLGVGNWKKAPPLIVRVVSPDAFNDASHFFGDRFAVYDPSARVIVATPPPEGADLAHWRRRFLAALAADALHRDVPVEVPAWLREGLMACMEAGGLANAAPDAKHPELWPLLKAKLDVDDTPSLPEAMLWSASDFLAEEKPERRAVAWGYVHLMVYGRGMVPTFYKRWLKELLAAKRKAPPLDMGKYNKERRDLDKHARKKWVE
ncbi:MAG: hypothetical protein O7E54_00085 [Planctomycetota bacterium]|nr:hypothetical protein [Planctomycetota bacterium]